MQRVLGTCTWLVCTAIGAGLTEAAYSAEAPEKVVLESWDAAYLGKDKAGYVHTVVREVVRDKQKFYRSTTELKLTLQRMRETITLRMQNGTSETETGVVTGVGMTQVLGKNQQRLITGVVKDGKLRLQVDDVQSGVKKRVLERQIPWNDKVIGLYAQERMFRERKVKPGDDSFSYQSYEPTISAVVTTRVTVKDFEEVDLRGKKAKLLRVVAKPDKIVTPNASIQLPTLTAWLDKEYTAQRSVVEVPGLGQLTLYRTTKADATGNTNASVPRIDIGISQLIPLKRRIVRPYDSKSAVYRITVRGDDDVATTFARDGRQSVKNVKGQSFELHVRAEPEASDEAEPAKVKDEFVKSNSYVNSDDARVKQLTRTAVGRETEPWRKALRIERWVYRNIENKNFTQAFATADHVARTLEGDCTEHAMLAAAMCRAAGVPSRTAIGLVYVDTRTGPKMGFHMWTEVWIKGQWRAIDATLGRGHVGATHLKITDHSWHDVQSLTPLLPVVRVVGKVSIEVVRVSGAE